MLKSNKICFWHFELNFVVGNLINIFVLTKALKLIHTFTPIRVLDKLNYSFTDSCSIYFPYCSMSVLKRLLKSYRLPAHIVLNCALNNFIKHVCISNVYITYIHAISLGSILYRLLILIPVIDNRWKSWKLIMSL